MVNRGSGLAVTVISTSLQATQHKAIPMTSLHAINPIAASTIKRLFANISQAEGLAQLPQPTVLTQRHGLQQQIPVRPVPFKASAPTQVTPTSVGVTILRSQQVPATSGPPVHSGQAIQ